MTKKIGRVTLIGSGTMGHGIAHVSTASGYDTRLYDLDEDALNRGMARVRANLEKGVALEKITPGDVQQTMARLTATTDLEGALKGADLVIEAVPEIPDLKARIFADVQELVGPDTILASNTSSLSIGDLARGVTHPERFVGLHFFNPVHIMKLVEVVWGPETAPGTVEAGVAFARSLNKDPIVVKDSPGFASSRLGILLGLEAMRMVEEGVASPEDIDTAMTLGYRHPMGPLKLTDLVGLDVRLGIAEYLHETLGSEAFNPPEILRAMVAEGRLGKKSGRGFYEWSDS